MIKDIIFKQKTETIKGKIGQQLLISCMLKRFPIFKLYPCSQQNEGSHCFDGIIIKNDQIVALYDVKTKPRRWKYEDTGIDKRSYDTYINVFKKYRKPFYLFFVDQYTKQIYYNTIWKLSKNIIVKNKKYPIIQNNYSSTIIYFPLVSMKLLCQLTDEQLKSIELNSSMNNYHKQKYNYNLRTVKQILQENQYATLF